MTTVTFYAPAHLTRRIQLAVMQFDGWFDRNPLEMFNNNSLFAISFNDPHKCNKFMTSLHIFQQPWF